MNFKNLFLALLFAFTLVACGSGNKSGNNDQKADETQVAIDQIFENGDKNIPGYIEISKESMTLKLYDKNGKIIYNFPIAAGQNYGNKKADGDMKTPEGEFVIMRIEPSTKWTYDFKDGNGPIEGAYGDFFLRLDTEHLPFKNIGIHGTHKPETIGTRSTPEGTIAIHNDDMKKLKPLVRLGMTVKILPSKLDMDADGKPAQNLAVEAPNVEEPKKDETKIEEPKPEVKPDTPTTGNNDNNAQVETPTYTPGEIIEHTVEKGQFVGHIAIKYNTSTAKILELNPDLVPEKIQIGQKIKVQPNTNTKPAQPAKPATTEDPNGTYHSVKSGDTLGAIAIKYNTTVAKIKELNNMENDNIRVNQRIRVK